MTTTAYKPVTNGQVQLFNRKLVTRITFYVAEYQKGLDTYVPILTNAYNTLLHTSIGLVPFKLTLTSSPRTSDIGFGLNIMPTDSPSFPTPIVLHSVIMQRLYTLFDRATTKTRKAQAAYKYTCIIQFSRYQQPRKEWRGLFIVNRRKQGLRRAQGLNCSI